MNKPISTKVHGMVDYASAAMLMTAPYFLSEDGGPEQTVPMALGAMTTVASLCTDYEMGVFPLISMKTHITLDIMNGLFLAASPFLFGFSKRTWLPHVLTGLGEVMTALMTETEPESVGQPTRKVGGKTQLEGYQRRVERSGSLQGVH